MKRTERYFQEFNYIQILLIPLHNSNRELDVIISTRDSSSSTNFRFEIQRDRNIRIKLKPSTLPFLHRKNFSRPSSGNRPRYDTSLTI